MTDLCDLPARELRRRIGARRLSPVELLESCIARIEAVDGILNAIPIRAFDQARAAAGRAERQVRAGEPLGPLHGLPVGIKDLNRTAGIRTTFGSPIYADTVPAGDDDFVARLKAAGSIVAGKTNTTEFGAGSNTTNAVFGPTRNPFDTALTSGGSSGGSAVAVATGMLPLCTGNDTGGSLRVPAGFCGVTSIRPSQGVVPYERRQFPFTPFSVQGPMARTVDDLILLFSVMAQPRGIDPLSFAVDHAELTREVDPSTLKVAVSPDLGFAPAGQRVRAAFAEKLAVFADAFAVCGEDAPDLASAPRVNWILRGVEYVGRHRRHYEEHRALLGPLVVHNYEEGLKVTVDDVIWAKTEQGALHRRVEAFFDRWDVLICPVASVPPFPVEQLYPESVDGEAQETYVRWAGLTNGLSVAGTPVVTLPCGRDGGGLPFGIQVVGRRGSDTRLLTVAAAIERLLAADPRTARPLPDLAALVSTVRRP
ncbi:amidase family protein [Azospirillum sp. TSO22-1]|uniref:amidase n=1 Tax=Azospirillum sp. TSO22-1 TaxID=716789 RepID=UPI000D61BDE1|nr:amidase family protein [Azospirillum sp. TSO22-1]PWC40373.1 hypothetical protein TSO221_25305 [Azospirillum sp. TSO22-1]